MKIKLVMHLLGDDVHLWMENWTNTPGVPIIHVIKEGNDVYVKQSPLLTPKCDDAKSMWIPIQYKTKVLHYYQKCVLF